MPKPANAKVWNETLVKALKARCEHERSLGRSTYTRWLEGARAIEAVRQEIYMFNNGRVVGLPVNLKVTVQNEVRGIINGERPILPEGFKPTDGDFEYDISNDPYLKKIKCNGGAFAILMAFHFSSTDTMTKAQICAAAQPYCDDAMEANYMAGRSYGAWKSIDTLQKHDLVHIHRAGARFTDNAWRSNGCNSYTISNNGKKFTRAMMEKFNIGSGQDPHSTMHRGAAAGPRFSLSPKRSPYKRGRAKPVTLTPGSSAKKSSRTTELHHTDKQELLEWLRTAKPMEKKMYKVGKKRRQMLHDLCDELMQKYSGLSLDHISDGTGNNRALYITLMSTASRMDNLESAASNVVSPNGMASHTSATISSPFVGEGHTLSEGSPKKKMRTDDIPAAVLAADAAMIRQANASKPNVKTEKKRDERQKTNQQKRLADILDSDIDSEDDDLLYDRKPAAVAKPKQQKQVNQKQEKQSQEQNKFKQEDVVELLDSDDEEEIPAQPRDDSKMQAKEKLEAKGSSDEPIELDDSQDFIQPCNLNFDTEDQEDEAANALGSQQRSGQCSASEAASSSVKTQLTILIDNRERDRNATPRQLRMDLTRHTSTGLLKRVWPSEMPEAEVIEKALVYGDFAFELVNNAYVRQRIPVAIERKRVSDLVQRSLKGDHWCQLQRMCGNCEYAALLIEGDTVTAGQFASGLQDFEDWTPDCFVIGDEKGFFLFAGRAILASRKTRFIQTKDEQSSLRAVGAHGLMAALSEVAQKNVTSSLFDLKREQTKLADRLVQGGIPWKLVRRVKDEIGSIAALEALYGSTCEAARGTLLCPIIQNSLPDFTNSVTSAAGWSLAIYSVWSSCLSDPQAARVEFDKHKFIVQDQGKLLCMLHSGKAVEVAIDIVLTEPESAPLSSRKVQVQLPSQLEHCFPTAGPASEETFYHLKTAVQNPYNFSAPTIAMHTRAGQFASSRLFVHIVEGTAIVESVERAMANHPEDFVAAAREAGYKLNQQCYSPQVSLDRDQRILLIRGLASARERAAKKPGYRQELLAVQDMTLADLSITYSLVILQVLRKKTEEIQMVVQQLALACFHYQLLTEKI